MHPVGSCLDLRREHVGSVAVTHDSGGIGDFILLDRRAAILFHGSSSAPEKERGAQQNCHKPHEMIAWWSGRQSFLRVNKGRGRSPSLALRSEASTTRSSRRPW